MSRRPAPVDPLPAAEAAAAGEAAMRVAHRFGSPVPLRVWQSQRMTSNTQPARHIAWTGRRAYWRELGADLWAEQGGGVRLTRDRPGRVVVWFGFPPGYRGRTRDPLNLAPVVKALVDGMVDAGLADDDAAHTIVGQDPRIIPGVVEGEDVAVIVHIHAVGGPAEGPPVPVPLGWGEGGE